MGPLPGDDKKLDHLNFISDVYYFFLKLVFWFFSFFCFSFLSSVQHKAVIQYLRHSIILYFKYKITLPVNFRYSRKDSYEFRESVIMYVFVLRKFYDFHHLLVRVLFQYKVCQCWHRNEAHCLLNLQRVVNLPILEKNKASTKMEQVVINDKIQLNSRNLWL